MSWRWQREGQNLASVCGLCGLVVTGRRDNDVTQAQRSHDAATCANRREAARDTDRGHQIDRVTYRMSEHPTTTTGATT